MLAEYKAAADWLLHFLAVCLLFSAAETQVPRARRAAGPNQINCLEHFLLCNREQPSYLFASNVNKLDTQKTKASLTLKIASCSSGK